MNLTLSPSSPPRLLQRQVAVTAGVLLVHAGVAWLLGQAMVTPTRAPETPTLILASVLTDLATPAPPPLRPAASPPPRPAPQAQPSRRQPAPQPSAAQTTSEAPASSTALAEAPASTAAASSASAPQAAVSPAAAAGQSVPHAAPSAPAVPPVVLPSSQADYLNNPPPAYPRMSRRMGEQGTVTVRMFISAEGRAERAEIRASSGYPRLDEAALETVQRWRYVPGKRAGVPEGMWFNIPVRFVLD